MLESPNSSYVWISYMAFHIGVGETDKARALADRALKTIHFRFATHYPSRTQLQPLKQVSWQGFSNHHHQLMSQDSHLLCMGFKMS